MDCNRLQQPQGLCALAPAPADTLVHNCCVAVAVACAGGVADGSSKGWARLCSALAQVLLCLGLVMLGDFAVRLVKWLRDRAVRLCGDYNTHGMQAVAMLAAQQCQP